MNLTQVKFMSSSALQHKMPTFNNELCDMDTRTCTHDSVNVASRWVLLVYVQMWWQRSPGAQLSSGRRRRRRRTVRSPLLPLQQTGTHRTWLHRQIDPAASVHGRHVRQRIFILERGRDWAVTSPFALSLSMNDDDMCFLTRCFLC